MGSSSCMLAAGVGYGPNLRRLPSESRLPPPATRSAERRLSPVSETYLRPTILTALQPTVSVLNTLQFTDEIHFKLSSSSLTADHIVLDGRYLLTLAGNQRMVVVKRPPQYFPETVGISDTSPGTPVEACGQICCGLAAAPNCRWPTETEPKAQGGMVENFSSPIASNPVVLLKMAMGPLFDGFEPARFCSLLRA